MTTSEAQKPPGWYFVGWVTKASLVTMTPEEQARWPLNTAMSNKTPLESAKDARAKARQLRLRNVTTIEVTP